MNRLARPTVFLFDIDGTLLSTGGAGRRSMEAAFRAAYGERGAAAIAFSFAGMTDRAIVRTGIRAVHGGDSPEIDAAIDAVLHVYVAHLADEVGRSEGYRVMPGVHDVLAWLRGVGGGVAIGLGTGNVKRGAYTKLERGSLHAEFAFGGFGCDAEERSQLLHAGARRGAEALGLEVTACRVVVIGDTPKDVTAARAIGATCVGVGTGGVAPSTLEELGAEHAFDDLTAAGVREALLGAG